MSGKSFARSATCAFMATRHGSPRLHCEKPTKCLADLALPQPIDAIAATTAAPIARLRTVPRSPLPPLALKPDRADDDDAFENELQVRIDIVQPHDVVQDSDDQNTDERTADG